MSSGWMTERWSTERAPHSQRDGDRAHRRELLDVRAQRQAELAGERAHAREVVQPEGDGLDEDVERVDVALARERLGLVHPRVGGEAGRHGVREQARCASSAGRPGRPARGPAARRAPRRRARGRSPSCPRTRSCRAAAARRRAPRPARAPASSEASASARAEDAMPPPARAISSYGTPVTLRSYSSARQPANGRCVWQSTNPGSTAQPDASTATSAPSSSTSPGSSVSSPARSWRRYGSPSSGNRRTCAAPWSFILPRPGGSSSLRSHGDPHPEPVGGLDRLVVARVDVAHDPHARDRRSACAGSARRPGRSRRRP